AKAGSRAPTSIGRAVRFASSICRKVTVVLLMGFRQLMRGQEKARGEWSLVTMAWNVKRMFTLLVA
ncbi:hypothetical protein, partial [Bradyrhizobium sp.]|uniref:hypothetical protein n=1 Tax=Bradyrhizobium sp. TaxID=376 RepID=UPI003C45025D